MAAREGRTKTVAALLSIGADIDAKDQGGNSSVWLAMEQKHEAAVEVLLQAIIAAGMDIDARYEGNARNMQGQTLLMARVHTDCQVL